MSEARPAITADQLKFCTISADLHVSSFDCGDDDLNHFIKDDALSYQDQKIAHTTCVYRHDKLVAYFAVCSDAIRLSDDEKLAYQQHKRIPSYPAIKLARMACTKEHQRCGLGKIVLEIVVGMAASINDRGVACRYITVDAYAGKEDWYAKRGFVRNQTRPNKGETISMRKDIFA